MKPDLGQLMRQAQQLQANMQKAQEQLGALEVVGEAGGGMAGAMGGLQLPPGMKLPF